ncbi:MAG: hypothetical protein WBC18_08450 [Ottowia sp.]|uniref:hypothetical protein n=1 Tax=Ottowia sp. TaxID=1898956 RepID=UPI003C70C2BF
MRLTALAPLVLTALLAACGGDDDWGPEPTLPSPMSGAWQASLSNGGTLNAVVLDDGRMWAVGIQNNYPGIQLSARTYAYAENGRFDSDRVRYFDYGLNDLFGGTLQGSYVANNSIRADLWLDGARDKSTYFLQPMPASMFNYNRPAVLNDIAGSWTSDGMQVSVGINGSFEMAGDTSCRASGSVRPHQSQKNVFSLNLVLSGPFCTFSGSEFDGIAVVWRNNGKDELMATALSVNSNYTLSLSLLSVRS